MSNVSHLLADPMKQIVTKFDSIDTLKLTASVKNFAKGATILADSSTSVREHTRDNSHYISYQFSIEDNAQNISSTKELQKNKY